MRVRLNLAGREWGGFISRIAVVGFLVLITVSPGCGGAGGSGSGDCSGSDGCELEASDGHAENAFGRSVAINDGVVVVGAHGDKGSGGDAGAAYIFRSDGGSWQEEKKLKGSSEEGRFNFARSVATDDEIVVVGTRVSDIDSSSLRVYSERRGRWVESDRLTATNGDAFDAAGEAIAIQNSTIVAGAPESDSDTLQNIGAVYVYELRDGDWTQSQRLVATTPLANVSLGGSVDIDGDLIVASAMGRVYIFRFNGSQWSREHTIRLGNARDIQVAVDGDRVVAGTPSGFSGAAQVYRFDGIGWLAEQFLPPPILPVPDDFGASVAIDCKRVIVGAPGRNADRGGFYTYRYSDELEEWGRGEFTKSKGHGDEERFGESLALDCDTAVVGSRISYDDPPEPEGYAFVYDL